MKDITEFSSFRTKCEVENFVEISDEKDVSKLQEIIKSTDDYYVLGGGTNLLFSKIYYPTKQFVYMNMTGFEKIGDSSFKVYAGQNLTKFVLELIKKYNLDTFTPLFGLPGSVGGAVIGNAGSFGINIGPFVESVEYVDSEGNLINTEGYEFAYRTSNLKKKGIVLLSVVLNIPDTTLPEQKNYKWYMNRRATNQEHQLTCGSYFKNFKLDVSKLENEKIIKKLEQYDDSPLLAHYNENKQIKTIPAGWLTQTLGLRGLSYNGVKLSERHGNFVINFDNKDPKNILELADSLKNKVFDKFGIMLEEEVQIV